MQNSVISAHAIRRRANWIQEIVQISGHFGQDSTRVESELNSEVHRGGAMALVDHLRLCGTIPENYGHDSSEEKLYSKYTDALLASAFRQIGLTSTVILERADAADVEAVAPTYGLVADAKVFRLSRTAKNQKDFKIEAMDGWKRGKPHAMVVCPIYQLPARNSQIYQQAISRNITIFSYSHLAVLVRFSTIKGKPAGRKMLLSILKCSEALNPSKDASAYWAGVNRVMLDFDPSIAKIWADEKIATSESIQIAKDEALTILARQREQIMRMSRKEAIENLIRDSNIDGREKIIRSVSDNGLLTIL